MDKTRGIVSVPLATERIEHLFSRLQENISNGSFRTEAELVRALFSVMNRLYKGHDKQIYTLPKILAGTQPDQNDINTLLMAVYNEMQYILKSVVGTGDALESDFNFSVTKIRKLQADLKYCYQQLGVYSLYITGYGEANHFAETFSNLDSIDVGSKFLGKEECFFDLVEGTASLPLKEERNVWNIKEISIGSRSNGVLGSNVEAETPVRGKTKLLHDTNPDTWMEYEKVVRSETFDHLRLELKIALDDPQPVNSIKIIPVLLGARTPPVVDSIDVSQDGKTWASIEKEIRVAEFIGENQEDRYHFSPHASRFAGEFSITFPPRYIQFIRVLLRQTSTFPIKDVYSNKYLRYAIGIREIEIAGSKHKSEGELISKEITFPSEIRAVALQDLVDPINLPAEAGGAEYFVSFDDGASWTQISPQDESSTEIPEVVFPPEGQSSLRYKVRLNKNEEAFAVLRREQIAKNMREVHGWGDISPLEIELKHKPIKGTVTVVDPSVAVIGKRYPRTSLGFGTFSRMSDDRTSREGATTLRLKIPVETIEDTSKVYIFVGGEVCTKTADLNDASHGWHSRVCQLSLSENGEWEVIFGNNSATSPKGFIPSPDQEVTLQIGEETLQIDSLAPPFHAKLDYPSNGEKKDTTIFFDGGIYPVASEVIPPGVTEYKLKKYPMILGMDGDGRPRGLVLWRKNTAGVVQESWLIIPPNSPIISPDPPDSETYFSDYKEFVDGSTELVDDGDWTVDTRNGVLYFYTASQATSETSINYYWGDRRYLRKEDWDFVEGKVDEIQIYESGYFAKEGSYNVSTTGNKYTSLRVDGLVPKSVRLERDFFDSDEIYYPYEVPFINGIDEFNARAAIQDEAVPTSTPSDAGGGVWIADFRLTQWQSMVASAGVGFSDTSVFAEEQTFFDGVTELANVGDYCIDYSGTAPSLKGTVYVRLTDSSDIPSDITVSYQYEDSYAAERIKGAYSVDAENSRVHFAIVNENAGTIYYKYAPYRIHYVMSYKLKEGEGEDYIIDEENKKITINAGARGFKRERLGITYKYQPDDSGLKTIAEYFSPLLRALAIRAALL